MKQKIFILSIILSACIPPLSWAEEEMVEQPAAGQTAPVESTPDIEPADMEQKADVPADDPGEPVTETTARAPTFVVILPEQIDFDWYWIMYTDTSQHLVQSAVEKALLKAGLDVIDLSTVSLPSFGNDWKQLLSLSYGLNVGRELKADYLITGKATAVKASEGFTYGVIAVRAQAEITAKIVRVKDGKVISIEESSMLEGGQSAQTAGQHALKKAGQQIAVKLARTARTLAETDAGNR